MRRWLVLGVAALASAGAVAWALGSPAARSTERMGVTNEQIAAQVRTAEAWQRLEPVVREMTQTRWSAPSSPWGPVEGRTLALWYRGYQEEVKLEDLAGHTSDPWSRARFRDEYELVLFCKRQVRHAEAGVAAAERWSPPTEAEAEIRSKFMSAVEGYADGWRATLRASYTRVTRERARGVRFRTR